MTTPAHRVHVAAALLFTLAVGAPVATASADEVTVYSARHYDEDRKLYDVFTEETGIEVRVLEADSDQLIQRIQREGAASPADILITVDAGRLWRAEQEGLFQSVTSEKLNKRLPDAMRHPDGLWFGFSQRLQNFPLMFRSSINFFDPLSSIINSFSDLGDLISQFIHLRIELFRSFRHNLQFLRCRTKSHTTGIYSIHLIVTFADCTHTVQNKRDETPIREL